MLKLIAGALIAFAMEFSEFLLVTYTSSLTLSIAGVFKVPHQYISLNNLIVLIVFRMYL